MNAKKGVSSVIVSVLLISIGLVLFLIVYNLTISTIRQKSLNAENQTNSLIETLSNWKNNPVQETTPAPEPPPQPTPYTVIYTTNTCDSSQIIMKLSQKNNSHGAEWGDSEYNYNVCYNNIFGKDYTGTNARECSPNNANDVVWLNQNSNSHASILQSADFNTPVCFGNLSCSIKASQSECDFSDGKIVASLFSSENSHISAGDDANFPVKICCRDATFIPPFAPAEIPGWYSAVEHGAYSPGEQLLEISEDGNFVEPRKGGIRKIIINFSEQINPATFTQNSVLIAGNNANNSPVDFSGVNISTSVSADGKTGIINFEPALQNGKYIIQLKDVNNASGALLTKNVTRRFAVLPADATSDLRVNVLDLSFMWGNQILRLSQNSSASHIRSDANIDGRVNVLDMSYAWGRKGGDLRSVDEPILPESSEPYLSIGLEMSEYHIGEQLNLTDPPQPGSFVSGEGIDVGRGESLINREQETVNGYIVEFKEEPIVAKEIELKREAEQAKELSKDYSEKSKVGFFLWNYYESLRASSLKSKYSSIQRSKPEEIRMQKQRIDSEHERALADLSRIEPGITGNVIFEDNEKMIIKEFKYAFNGIVLNITKEKAEQLKKSRYVKNVYPNEKISVFLDSSIPAMHIDSARNSFGLDGEGITIAVIDTGIDAEHESLDCVNEDGIDCEKKVVGWKDFINFKPEPYDDHGHGTHVSGIAAGTGGEEGIYKGVAPKAKLVGVKVLNSWGGGNDDSVISGIEWVIQNKDIYNISIISMSLGKNKNSDGTDPIDIAVDYAVEYGINVVVAAGNSGPNKNTVGVPASAFNVITVGAVDDNMKITGWSSRGPTKDGRIKPDIAAVGLSVMAPDADTGNGYVSHSGTSMATPHVAGFVALLLQQNPSLNTSEVKDILHRTAVDKGDAGADNVYGHGVLDGLSTFLRTNPPQHEISVDMETPAFFEIGKQEQIKGILTNFGLSEENIEVSLLINGNVHETKFIGLLGGEEKDVLFSYLSDIEGRINISVLAVPVSGEISLDNNEKTKDILSMAVAGRIKAVVVDSWGTDKAEYANFDYLNANWMGFGNYAVNIDYSSLNKEDMSYEDILNTNADVLIISDAWANGQFGMMHEFKDSEIEAIKRYVKEGHGLIGTSGTLSEKVANNIKLAELFGIKDKIGLWSDWDAYIDGVGFSIFVNDAVLTKNIPAIYSPSDNARGAVANLEINGEKDTVIIGKAQSEIDLWKNIFISAYKPEKGASVYFSNIIEIGGGNNEDSQFFYNAILWTNLNRGVLEKDIGLKELNVSKKARLNETLFVSAKVKNNRINAETANVEFKVDNEVKAVKEVLLNSQEEQQVDFSYAFDSLGMKNVLIEAIPLAGESYIINNRLIEQVLVPSAEFSGSYSDAGVDEDGNGLHEKINITLGVNVFENENYYLAFDVTSFLGVRLESVSRGLDLNPSDKSISINVPLINLRKIGLNGPYKIKNLKIMKDGKVMDKKDVAFTTRAYKISEFEKPSKFTGNFSDYGIDEDGDGLYDYLAVNAEVDIKKSSNYYVRGGLDRVAWAGNIFYLESGIQNVTLLFPGADIRKSGIDGPYLLYELFLELEGENWETEDYLHEAYETGDYSFTDFENVRDVAILITNDFLLPEQENDVKIEVANRGTEQAKDISVSLYSFERFWNGSEEIETLELINQTVIESIDVDSWKEAILKYNPGNANSVNLKAVVSMVDEDVLDNNEYNREMRVKPLGPDLSAWISYADYIQGVESDVSFLVYNHGTETATNISASLYSIERFWNDSGEFENLELIGIKNLRDLNVYDEVEESIKWTPEITGGNELRLVVSNDNEAYYLDNVVQYYVYVKPNYPYLVGSIIYERMNKIAGKNTFIKIRVKNNGAQRADSARITLHRIINEIWNGTDTVREFELIGSKDLGSIEPEEYIETELNYLPKEAGYYSLWAEFESSSPNLESEFYNSGFSVVPKSMINNPSGASLNGRLIMKLHKMNCTEFSCFWHDLRTVVDEDISIGPKSYAALDKIWLENGAHIFDEAGNYIVYGGLYDSNGEVLNGLDYYSDIVRVR